MRFGELIGFVLLTVLVTSGILLAGRLAPQQMTQPTKIMAKAMTNVEKAVHEARPPESVKQKVERMAPPGGGGGGGGPAGAIGASIASSGFTCPFVRRVVPITGGDGIFTVICADSAQGGHERAYRLDTRSGAASPEAAPIA